MGRHLSPRYGQVILVSSYPVLKAVNWSQHWCAISFRLGSQTTILVKTFGTLCFRWGICNSSWPLPPWTVLDATSQTLFTYFAYAKDLNFVREAGVGKNLVKAVFLREGGTYFPKWKNRQYSNITWHLAWSTHRPRPLLRLMQYLMSPKKLKVLFEINVFATKVSRYQVRYMSNVVFPNCDLF